MAEKSGWQELHHTADWAIRAHAPDFPGLLLAAAEGMSSLMGIRLSEEASRQAEFTISAPDKESLLVGFLNEILYLMETEKAGFTQVDIEYHELTLNVTLQCRNIDRKAKEIKAVTYHNLRIRQTENGFSTVLTFDV